MRAGSDDSVAAHSRKGKCRHSRMHLLMQTLHVSLLFFRSALSLQQCRHVQKLKQSFQDEGPDFFIGSIS
jgi:hypothetical protein